MRVLYHYLMAKVFKDNQKKIEDASGMKGKVNEETV